jgi:uncharacterized protein (TIGR00369 family)
MTEDFETRVRESFARQGFMRTLGAELVEVGEGTTAIRLPRGEPVAQQHGYMHAGALIAVVDTACGYAALTVAPPDSEVLTSELKINLLSPAAGAAVIARGRVVRAGRRLTVCQGDVYDADDPARHLATMLGTVVVVPSS